VGNDVADGRDQRFGIEGFGEVGAGATIEGGLGDGFLGQAGQHDQRQIVLLAAQGQANTGAVETR